MTDRDLFESLYDKDKTAFRSEREKMMAWVGWKMAVANARPTVKEAFDSGYECSKSAGYNSGLIKQGLYDEEAEYKKAWKSLTKGIRRSE